MESTKYEQQIWDLEQKEAVPYGTMLKRLCERQGLGRNEWHEKATELSNRHLGPANKLSDIFSNNRKLPLRDIYPYISALGLPFEQQEHYVCEYLKAFIDPSLVGYIGTTKRDKLLEQMQQKLSLTEDLYAYEFNRACYLEKKLIPDLVSKHKIRFARSERMLFSSLNLEPESMLELSYDAYQTMQVDLESMISELCFKTPSFDASIFLSALIPKTYNEQLRLLGKRMEAERYAQSWIRYLPKVNNLEKIGQNILVSWLSLKKNRLERFLSIMRQIEEQPLGSREYFKCKLRKTIGEYFKECIIKFKKEYPKSYSFLFKYDGTFRVALDTLIEVQYGYEKLKQEMLEKGNSRDALIALKNETIKLNISERRKLLSCYLKYVYLKDATRLDIETLNKKLRSEYSKKVNEIVKSKIGLPKAIAELNKLINRIKESEEAQAVNKIGEEQANFYISKFEELLTQPADFDDSSSECSLEVLIQSLKVIDAK